MASPSIAEEFNFHKLASTSFTAIENDRRQSFSFSETGRKSLLPNDIKNDSFGRESIGILHLNGRESMGPFEFGRESLGILSTFETNEIPGIVIEDDEDLFEIGDINVGFPALSPRKFSSASSTSSYSLLNWQNLDGPSKIFSLYSPGDGTLNKAMMESADFSSMSALNNAMIDSMERSRLSSLPNPKHSLLAKTNEALKKHCSFSCVLGLNEKELDDSVFYEAKKIASQIESSILSEDSSAAAVLDNTPQPEWSTASEDADKIEPNDIDSYLKTVDQLAPINKSAMNNSLNGSHNTSRLSAKEVLLELSDIIQNEHRSETSKVKSQKLLQQLAGILDEPNSNNLEDSGHSSNEEHHSNEETDVSKLMNNSKASGTPYKRRLSQSLTGASPRPLIQCKNSEPKKSNSMSSIGSNESPLASASKLKFAGKFKSKLAESSFKRGPLKATTPLSDMLKRGANTPKKTDQKLNLMERTSTPLKERKLLPMAQSTPTPSKKSSSNNENKPPSTEKHPTTPRKMFVGSQISRPIASSPARKARSNSMSEKPNLADVKIGRRNSIGKETGIMSALSKVRQNILNSPYYQEKDNLETSGSKVVSKKVWK